MEHENTEAQPFTDPINPNWTIEQLLDALSPTDSPDESLAPPLSRIERSLSTAVGAPASRCEPSAVALIRSIALLCGSTPALRSLRLGELNLPSKLNLPSEQNPTHLPHPYKERAILL